MFSFVDDFLCSTQTYFIIMISNKMSSIKISRMHRNRKKFNNASIRYTFCLQQNENQIFIVSAVLFYPRDRKLSQGKTHFIDHSAPSKHQLVVPIMERQNGCRFYIESYLRMIFPTVSILFQLFTRENGKNEKMKRIFSKWRVDGIRRKCFSTSW